jgi:pyruvate, water dikinase
MSEPVRWFADLRLSDLAQVGGKNASLGEMIGHLTDAGVRVPGGFATTADAYREFLARDGLDRRINDVLQRLDVNDVPALQAAGAQIRGWVESAALPPSLERAVAEAYATLERDSPGDLAVAVRSSATAEDLPDASFAGQQETFLNVRGLPAVLAMLRRVYASLFTDRAIAYRAHQGFDHAQVALSVGVQRMVRSDLGAAGVMFTLDTESGFRDAVFVTAAYGLGESVVQGSVNPDEFYVYKPALRMGRPAVLARRRGSKAMRMIYASEGGTTTQPVPPSERGRFCLTDADVEALARQALLIEAHYGRPMDIEWGKDGQDGGLYILQARPETVRSRNDAPVLRRYELAGRGEVLASGRSVGQAIGAGPVRVVRSPAEMDRVRDGDVLVADMTDPDWEPVMKRAAAIVTNRGGRTCHAAIIARELGIPAVVGCGDATQVLSDETPVTVSCAQGDTGYVYAGALAFKMREVRLDAMPAAPVKLMVNIGNPEHAFTTAALPAAGVGLARVEFIIARTIGVHPRALLEYDALDPDLRAQIAERIGGYAGPREYYVQKLAEGVATLAAAFHPRPVIVRLSDFKSNEYASLLGGTRYEPHEENPMLGFRGASRYVAPAFAECFALECEALRHVREAMGLDNVWVMVPFVRTVDEARRVTGALAAQGLERGRAGLKLIMMCELPSNALLAPQFLEYFDGYSIGSNDLTQLTLGLDRDSGLVAEAFDERDAAVRVLMERAIRACREAGKYVGICGQGPSDHPDLAQWLLEQGIESISLNPDTLIETWLRLAK